MHLTRLTRVRSDRWCALLLLALLVPVSGGARLRAAEKPDQDPTNPPQGVFADDWYAVRLLGKKAGYMHTVMRREGDIILSKAETVLRISRGGPALEVKMTQSTRETVTGTPLSFHNEMTLAATKMTYQGTIEDGKLELSTTQFFNTQKRTYDFDPRARLAWGLFLEQTRHGLEKGTEYDAFVYDPALKPDGPIRVEVKIGGKETIDLFGRLTEAIHTTQDMQVPLVGQAMRTESWLDKTGTPLRIRSQVMSIKMEMIKCPKDYALELGEPPEMFISSLIKSNRHIDRDNAKTVVCRLSLSGADAVPPTLPETGMQKITARDKSAVTLTITRQDHKALAAAEPVKIPDALAEFLRPSVFLNHDDPVVSKMAKAAAGDETHPYKLAHKLRRYVTEEITEKNLNVGFATASEVARSREGDCSEHAVLLAALARANGLPARTVSGIIYVDGFLGKRQVFGYHMWTQVWIAGQWVDLDAAQRQTDCDPTHIALAIMPMNDAGFADGALALVNVIGRLKIDVQKVE